MRQNIAGTLRGAYANTLVTDAEDCLRVRHDEQLDIATLCLFEEVFFHGVLVSKGEIQTLAPAKEVRVVRYSIPLDPAMNDREEKREEGIAYDVELIVE